MKRHLTRRRFLTLAAAAGVGAAAGCSGGLAKPPDLSKGRDRDLRILNWPDYIDEETVDRFMAEVGVGVDYSDAYADNDYGLNEVFNPKLLAGERTGFDIIVPTYWVVDRLLTAGVVEPVPIERVPNHVNIDPAFLTMPWDRGARFHMPWQVGITGIAYNPALSNGEVPSIQRLLDLGSDARVGMVTEMREVVGLLMLLNGDDPSRVTADAANEALDDLADLVSAGKVSTFTFEFADALKTNDLAASLAWSGDIVQLQAERPDIQFVIPEEGGIRWFDSMIIPAGAEHVRAAADWMNFVYDPENAANITGYVQYISPVLGVREVLEGRGGEEAALADNPILFPDDETRRRLYFWAGVDAATEDDLQARFSEITGA